MLSSLSWNKGTLSLWNPLVQSEAKGSVQTICHQAVRRHWCLTHPTPTPHASFTDSHSSCDLGNHPPFRSDTELLPAVADPKVIHSSPRPPVCTLSFIELFPNPEFLCYLGNPDCFLLFPLFSHQVTSDSLWPHGLQRTRFPCPSLPPGVCSNSCPLSPWCYPTISTSVTPSSCCPQSFPASKSFPTSWLFASGGQSTGASVSASVLPMNILGWYPLGLTGLISLLSKGLSRVFSSTTIWKHQFSGTQPSLWSGSHIHTWLLEKA